VGEAEAVADAGGRQLDRRSAGDDNPRCRTGQELPPADHPAIIAATGQHGGMPDPVLFLAPMKVELRPLVKKMALTSSTIGGTRSTPAPSPAGA
jgi:hypothetical protein